MPPKVTVKPRRKATVKSTQLSTSVRIELAPDDPTRDTNLESVQVFINQALKRFTMAADAEGYNRTEGLVDLQMVDGEGQWDSTVKEMRIRKKRPCLTINRFIPMIAHVGNEMRAARPGIQIDPVGSGADPESAQIRQGLIRHIEMDSDAESVYDNAFDAMLEKGWSWIRMTSQYEDDESLSGMESFNNQKLVIEGFENDFCVYSDPTAKHPTRKDMEWAFVIDDVPAGEYLTLYPKSKMRSLSNFSSIGDESADWMSGQHVRVAEYYYLEKEEAILYQLEDGSGRWKDTLQEVQGMFVDKALFDASEKGEVPPELVPIIEVSIDPLSGQPVQRKSTRKKVCWCKINAVEILEGNEELTEGRDLQSKYIPLIMVQGRVRNIRGQRRLSGMVRNNRDAQRMYNYWVTAFTEMVALAPKSPWIAAAGQIEKYKAIWDTANDEAWPYLPYDAINVNGTMAPAPQRQAFEPPVQAIGAAIRQADNDLKAGFNIYDAALGSKGPQESGKAILARKIESDSGNAHWLDNMRKAIQHVGDIAMDWIPTRYDAARVVSIVRPDNKREMVVINEEFKDKNGELKHFDMSKGKFSCVVKVGPGGDTKRQEAVEAMMQLVSAEPQLFMSIGDLIVENMDWPGAQAIVERLRKMLPPNLQEDKGDGKLLAAQLQAKLDAMTMQHEQLTAALDKANGLLDSKSLEIASRERIEALKAEVQLAAITSKEDIESFKAEVARIEGELAVIRQPGPVEKAS